MDDAQLGETIKDYLDSHTVLNLATSGPQGPHAASVFFARQEFELFWFSETTTRHSGILHEVWGALARSRTIQTITD